LKYIDKVNCKFDENPQLTLQIINKSGFNLVSLGIYLATTPSFRDLYWECNSLSVSKSAGGNISGFSSLKMGLID
jgi:hypothetical protein